MADICYCCSKLKGMGKEYGRKGRKQRTKKNKGKKERWKGMNIQNTTFPV
jgi:hypothetical protein